MYVGEWRRGGAVYVKAGGGGDTAVRGRLGGEAASLPPWRGAVGAKIANLTLPRTPCPPPPHPPDPPSPHPQSTPHLLRRSLLPPPIPVPPPVPSHEVPASPHWGTRPHRGGPLPLPPLPPTAMADPTGAAAGAIPRRSRPRSCRAAAGTGTCGDTTGQSRRRRPVVSTLEVGGPVPSRANCTGAQRRHRRSTVDPHAWRVAPIVCWTPPHCRSPAHGLRGHASSADPPPLPC